MAVAEIIGAAIGVLLLVVVAYLLVGGTLTAAETVANAQKDLTLINEARLRTSITISDQKISGSRVYFNVTNTGNEVISDFIHADMYSYNNSLLGYQTYKYDRYNFGTKGNWTITRFENDYIHPNQLDPGEKMWCEAVFIGANPVWIKMVTGNGVYDSDYI
jgi:archaeal flagellar protein FlaF